MKKFITETLLKYRGVIEELSHTVDYRLIPDEGENYFKFEYLFEITMVNRMNGQWLDFRGKSENYGKAMQEAIDEAEAYLKDIELVYKPAKTLDV